MSSLGSPHAHTAQAVKALDVLEPSSDASRKCLSELRSVCGTRGILPTPYTLSPQLQTIGHEPFASGGYGDMYEGTLDGSRVCIKRLRAYTDDGLQNATKVRPAAFLSSVRHR